MGYVTVHNDAGKGVGRQFKPTIVDRTATSVTFTIPVNDAMLAQIAMDGMVVKVTVAGADYAAIRGSGVA